MSTANSFYVIDSHVFFLALFASVVGCCWYGDGIEGRTEVILRRFPDTTVPTHQTHVANRCAIMLNTNVTQSAKALFMKPFQIILQTAWLSSAPLCCWGIQHTWSKAQFGAPYV